MTSKEYKEYMIIRSAVDIIANTCTCCPSQIIEHLTGHAWDEEEASGIIAAGHYETRKYVDMRFDETINNKQ